MKRRAVGKAGTENSDNPHLLLARVNALTFTLPFFCIAIAITFNDYLPCIVHVSILHSPLLLLLLFRLMLLLFLHKLISPLLLLLLLFLTPSLFVHPVRFLVIP